MRKLFILSFWLIAVPAISQQGFSLTELVELYETNIVQDVISFVERKGYSLINTDGGDGAKNGKTHPILYIRESYLKANERKQTQFEFYNPKDVYNDRISIEAKDRVSQVTFLKKINSIDSLKTEIEKLGFITKKNIGNRNISMLFERKKIEYYIWCEVMDEGTMISIIEKKKGDKILNL
jgi:hypothetical protein